MQRLTLKLLPISLLLLLSKTIEKSIHVQIDYYLHNKKLIYIYQSGFRTNHSTYLCLTQLIEFVLTGMDKQTHIGMIFVDLQKAFDILDHGLLLEKSKYFGFLTS